MRLVTLLVLAACVTDPPDTGTPPIPPWLVDDDDDAYSADVDCDDTDPDVHPGASEVCDLRDQDCDGRVDEDAVDAARWYSDDDGDGVGDDYGFTRSCDPVPDTLTTGGDCDDGDADVHPGALERCNGVDDDCDDATDEGDLPDEPTWHRDADGDGYGDPGDAVIVCDAPEGYVADATDCDDTDATISPAGTETCDDLDEDCDGLVDEDAVDAYLFYADLDDDTWGDVGTTRYACLGGDGWT
ncbi:MAG: MopE-related protein, partial [Myxococcota bacterium]